MSLILFSRGKIIITGRDSAPANTNSYCSVIKLKKAIPWIHKKNLRNINFNFQFYKFDEPNHF
jgi:hypothetical protein